jgi:hypothetical protein
LSAKRFGVRRRSRRFQIVPREIVTKAAAPLPHSKAAAGAAAEAGASRLALWNYGRRPYD